MLRRSAKRAARLRAVVVAWASAVASETSVPPMLPPLIATALAFGVAIVPSPRLPRALAALARSERLFPACNAPVMRGSLPAATVPAVVPKLAESVELARLSPLPTVIGWGEEAPIEVLPSSAPEGTRIAGWVEASSVPTVTELVTPACWMGSSSSELTEVTEGS